MPRLVLTDKFIAGVTVARQTPFFDLRSPVVLRVTPRGHKAWVVVYRRHGRPRWHTLGMYPDMTLAEARVRAKDAKGRVKDEGADPAHERQEAQRAPFSVNDLWKIYLERHAKPKKKRWQDDQSRYHRHIDKPWGRRAVMEITRTDVHGLLDQIAADRPIEANRVLRLLSKMWNVAIDREHTDRNPCHRMPLPSAERPREQVASEHDLRALWAGLDAMPGQASDAIRARLLTAQRPSNVYHMTWNELDRERGSWTIPGSRSKNGKPHRVPLTSRMLELLEARRPLVPKDVQRVFPDVEHWKDDVRALAELHGNRYRWYDLRRTIGSHLAEMGWSGEHRGALLGHARKGVTDVHYNEYRYDREKRQMLEAWDRELTRILSGEWPELRKKVVSLG